MHQLTARNYYSPEANQQYMSVSQYKDFRSCEAMALARLRGGYQPPAKPEYLVGNYIHAWSEGSMAQFIRQTPEMFTQKGTLRAEFKLADTMIETLKNDPLCMFALDGSKEVIMTGEFAGTLWKIRMDVYNQKMQRRIVDLKTTKSITELVWSVERWARVSFIEAYNYLLQAAVYGHIEKLNMDTDIWAEPYIVAVSKEDPPDKAVISLLDEARLNQELYEIENNLPRILEVKSGRVKPISCGKCAYCRSVKKLSRVIHYSELEAVK